MRKAMDCDEVRTRQTHKTNVESSLNQEIMELQKQLEDQFLVRHILEKALSYQPLQHLITNDNSIPKPTKELIKDIAALELEVLCLEQYLLSLYRKIFYQQMSTIAVKDGSVDSALIAQKGGSLVVPSEVTVLDKKNSTVHSGNLMSARNSHGNPLKECNDIWETQKIQDSSIHRSQSSLSQHSACSIRTSPMMSLNKAVDSYHSLPLSMLEQTQNETLDASLEEQLGTCWADHIPNTPNHLSEEVIKCISAIFCELADQPLIYQDSPVAFSSSIYELSSQNQSEKWQPRRRKKSFSSSHVDNPFELESSEEFSGPYCRMLKVSWICRDAEKLKDVEHMLQKYRSLVYRLEEVDLRKMKHEEKLAFWINVHNALVMHAFLVYGIPQNKLKRASLLLKAAYNVGGQTISVDVIQKSILGCRLPYPGQWLRLRLLLSSKTKFKGGVVRKAYAIEHPEPLLHFALCSGSRSDPAVRVYTSKRVFEELETAKEEYIQSAVNVNKDLKILLPKIVESFAKDSGLCLAGLAELVEHFIPNSQRKSIKQRQHKKSSKGIEWIPHNFTFQYLLTKEVAW